MIKIYTNDDEVKVVGHAVPDICAAVSSAMYTTANSILNLQSLGIDDGESLVIDNLEDDYMLIKIGKHSEITDVLVDTLKQGLQDIADDSSGLVEIIKES
jgi:uncharacterized protein YsxB (DUF464 family)